MDIPANPTSAGQSVNGKVSWFGGPHDAETGNSKTASGASTSEPGIAIYNRATLGGYWKVTANNGKTAVLKQTDLGPAPFTGRAIDVTYSALGKFGYNEGNFPTDSTFKAVYLGHNPGAAVKEAPSIPQPTATAQTTVKLPGAPRTETSFNEAAYRKASSAATIGKLFSPAERANNPLFSTGILSTTEPSKAEYTVSKTIPGTPAVSRETPASSMPGVPGGSPVASIPSAGGSSSPGLGAPSKMSPPPAPEVAAERALKSSPSKLGPAIVRSKAALERAAHHPVSLGELKKEVDAGTKGRYAIPLPAVPRKATKPVPKKPSNGSAFGPGV